MGNARIKLDVKAQETPKFRLDKWKIGNCTWCGISLKDSYDYIICQKRHPFASKGLFLCKDCAKKCKTCGKYFCPKHIDNHKCK